MKHINMHQIKVVKSRYFEEENLKVINMLTKAILGHDFMLMKAILGHDY
jgi:hypothetical protein